MFPTHVMGAAPVTELREFSTLIRPRLTGGPGDVAWEASWSKGVGMWHLLGHRMLFPHTHFSRHGVQKVCPHRSTRGIRSMS